MIGMNNPIIFYPLIILIVVFALLSILMKNIFYSLISAIVVFLLSGVVFYVLGSEYNAVIQLAIYGVAVPVILGLAIMFTNTKNKRSENTEINMRYLVFLTSGIFILGLIYLILTSLAVIPSGFNISEAVNINSLQAISAIATSIFVKYVWAFELVSVILTIVVVGLTIIKKEVRCKK